MLVGVVQEVFQNLCEMSVNLSVSEFLLKWISPRSSLLDLRTGGFTGNKHTSAAMGAVQKTGILHLGSSYAVSVMLTKPAE